MKSLIFSSVFLFSILFNKQPLLFKTLNGDVIKVDNDIIYFNDRPISEKIDDIIYESKYSRIIEQSKSTFLFLEIDNNPNFNELKAFKITPTKAVELVTCVYNDKNQGIGPSPFLDIDNDHNEEFGGFDITEVYPSKDSMYYNPSRYYEIKNGNILFDSILTKQMDIKVNGIYLRNPLDHEGNCCIVIKKPVTKGFR
jgi:hypothetical protein